MLKRATQIFVVVDDFCKVFEPQWQEKSIQSLRDKRRKRRPALCLSELMTILLLFQVSGFRHFKSFFLALKSNPDLKRCFPKLPSYTHFLALEREALIPLCAFAQWIAGDPTGNSFIDSTGICVCKNKRISSHKVFRGLAARGKNTMGWFFGFKLHIVISDTGRILNFSLTPGNTDDRKQVEKLCKGLWGNVFGDKGYIDQNLFRRLFQKGVRIVTSLKQNMKPKIATQGDGLLLGRRSLVESVFNVLKNSQHLEHSRHRSVWNFMVNLVGAICGYGLRFVDGFTRIEEGL
jgi:hypothetical protein